MHRESQASAWAGSQEECVVPTGRRLPNCNKNAKQRILNSQKIRGAERLKSRQNNAEIPKASHDQRAAWILECFVNPTDRLKNIRPRNFLSSPPPITKNCQIPWFCKLHLKREDMQARADENVWQKTIRRSPPKADTESTNFEDTWRQIVYPSENPEFCSQTLCQVYWFFSPSYVPTHSPSNPRECHSPPEIRAVSWLYSFASAFLRQSKVLVPQLSAVFLLEPQCSLRALECSVHFTSLPENFVRNRGPPPPISSMPLDACTLVNNAA